MISVQSHCYIWTDIVFGPESGMVASTDERREISM